MRAIVIIVGAFPPPIHGMAVVNAAMRGQVKAAGVEPVVINLAAPSIDRSFFVRLARLPKVLRGLRQLLIMPGLRGAALYMSVSGGFGQVYEAAFLVIAKLRGMRCFLHHHSYAYLDRFSMLTKILVAASGKHTTHVTLSDGMANRLKRLYGKTGRVLTLSNTALLAVGPVSYERERSRLKTVGFLSNVSEEKGVFKFLDVAEAMEGRGCEVSFRVAGPFRDQETERAVRTRLAALRFVEYVGPKYGMEKQRFFEDIDVLLFPSTYFNEAEPITIHEALMHGVPVIAYGRGCISDILTGASGLIVNPQQDFVGPAVERIETWLASAQTLRAASEAARARFHTLRNQATITLESLLHEMCDGAVISRRTV